VKVKKIDGVNLIINMKIDDIRLTIIGDDKKNTNLKIL
jgi:hypothetical protein